jgi:glycosyltransferase involved in cell wall biosynthesis
MFRNLIKKKGLKKLSKKNSLITIVTVVLNGEKDLERTILSVINQSYENIEYIVIDGGSTDGTLDIIERYKDKIDHLIIEKDKGIYDAMNKGINIASGDWINFMNSGDIFYDKNTLLKFYKKSKKYLDVDFFYSDSFIENGKKFICDKTKRKLIHQAIIYKLKVHKEVGNYICCKNFITADYLFFMMTYNYKWIKLNFPISIHNVYGVSSGLINFLQKNAIDLLFGFNGRIKTILLMMLHPLYHKIKNFLK